jgi:hypothetical protein
LRPATFRLEHKLRKGIVRYQFCHICEAEISKIAFDMLRNVTELESLRATTLTRKPSVDGGSQETNKKKPEGEHHELLLTFFPEGTKIFNILFS